MRWAVPLLVCALMLAPGVLAYNDFRDPGLVNKVISELSTPQVAPGETGFLSFNVTNMHATEPMENGTLTVGIYNYMTVNEKLAISGVDDPPRFLDFGGGVEVSFPVATLQPLESRRYSLQVATTDDTPHGDYFSQAAYSVRFKLVFNAGNETLVYQSKGFFSEDDWESLYDQTDEGPRFNKTRLFAMDLDGVIPDTTIGVRKEIPRACMYLLYAGVGVLLMTGYLFYVWENPSSFPWLYNRMASVRGKVISKRGPPKNG